MLEHIRSFEPIANKAAAVLILGTMPGPESLNNAEYYAYKRNAFWHIMGELFGAGFDIAYQQRCNILLQNNIAVWDVLKSCQRKGSGDLDIKNEIPNDFTSFFRKYSAIQHIFFNGRNAERFYRRLVLPNLPEKYQNFAYITLPSTSPANAYKDFKTKLTDWRVIKAMLTEQGLNVITSKAPDITN